MTPFFRKSSWPHSVRTVGLQHLGAPWAVLWPMIIVWEDWLVLKAVTSSELLELPQNVGRRESLKLPDLFNPKK
jgi:hypothetical protein